VAQLTDFLQHYITKASKEGRELFHLSFAEWITEMKAIRKKKSKAGSLHIPWRLRIGIFQGPLFMVSS
jgi:hypothetical protein